MLEKEGIKHRSHLYGHHENNYEPFRDQHFARHEDPATYKKKQHFVHGKGGGGSSSNKFIYGGLNSSSDGDQTNASPRLKQTFYASQLPRPDTYPLGGFLYGKGDSVPHNGSDMRRYNSFYEERSSAEIRKMAAQRIEKEREMERYREDKARKLAERTEEKKKDLDMLKSYQPWGKPGGGAPNKGSLYDNGRTRQIEKLLADENQLPLGRPGGGAPNRTESGRIKAALRTDPEVQLQTKKEGKNHHLLAEKLHLRENARQWNPDTYRTELEKLAEESRIRRTREKESELKTEMETLQYNPYGRPGGGAPIRDSQGQVKAGLPLQLSNDIYQLRDVENRHPHAFNDLNSERPEYFNIDLFRKGTEREGQKISHERNKEPSAKLFGKENIGGAGAPRLDKDGRVVAGIPQSLVKQKDGLYASYDRASRHHPDPEVEDVLNFHPWGKPGAGAPLRDEHGKLRTHVAGKVKQGQMEMEKGTLDSKKEYLETLRHMAIESETTKAKERQERLQETQPVASWLRQGKVGQPHYDPVTNEIRANPLVTSDVTRNKLQIRSQKPSQAKDYLHDLSEQEKFKREEYERLQKEERQRSAEHAKTMDRFWGREGNGAPLFDNRKKKHELQPSTFSTAYRGV